MEDSHKSIEIPISIEFENNQNQGHVLKINNQLRPKRRISKKIVNLKEPDFKKRERNKKSLIKQVIVEVFSKSTMHGVSRIFQKFQIFQIKFIWIIFLIASSSIFTTISLKSVFNFKKHDVTTKVRTIYERPTIFPTITICNKNYYNTDYAMDLLKNDIQTNNLPDIFNYTELLKLSLNERKSVISSILFTFNDKAYPDSEKKKLGKNINEILLSCIFNNIECTEDDFVWHFDKSYGNFHY